MEQLHSQPKVKQMIDRFIRKYDPVKLGPKAIHTFGNTQLPLTLAKHVQEHKFGEWAQPAQVKQYIYTKLYPRLFDDENDKWKQKRDQLRASLKPEDLDIVSSPLFTHFWYGSLLTAKEGVQGRA